MARALLRAGFGVHVWNRTQSKAAALVTDGARQASSPAEAATGVDVLRKTVLLDRVGDGSRLKLALNNWLVVLIEGMVETLTLTEALGLDPHLFLETVAAGPMASNYAITKGVAMLNADFVPVSRCTTPRRMRNAR